MKAKIIACAQQKGGVGKTSSCANLSVALAMAGYKVLNVDCDPQGSLAVSFGIANPDTLDVSLATILEKVITDAPLAPKEGIIHLEEGPDLLPANVELSGMEVSLVNTMSRETVLKQYLAAVRKNYDYILLDCPPSLGMMTINALSASDSVMIPVQAQYLPTKGLELLMRSIGNVRRQLNPKLKIDGIFLTMVDTRTNFSKDIAALVREHYGEKIRVFQTEIPYSIRAAETSAVGKSIFRHDPKGKVAQAYGELTKEVIKIEKLRQKHKADIGR